MVAILIFMLFIAAQSSNRFPDWNVPGDGNNQPAPPVDPLEHADPLPDAAPIDAVLTLQGSGSQYLDDGYAAGFNPVDLHDGRPLGRSSDGSVLAVIRSDLEGIDLTSQVTLWTLPLRHCANGTSDASVICSDDSGRWERVDVASGSTRGTWQAGPGLVPIRLIGSDATHIYVLAQDDGGNRLVALASTGVAWSVEVGEPSSVTLADTGALLVRSRDRGTMLVLERATGETRRTIEGSELLPAWDGVFSSSSATSYSLFGERSDDRRRVQIKPCCASTYPLAEYLPEAVGVAVTDATGRVRYIEQDRAIRDAQTGRDLGFRGFVTGITRDGSVLFVNSNDLVAVDAKTGMIRGHLSTTAAVTIVDGVIVLADNEGYTVLAPLP